MSSSPDIKFVAREALARAEELLPSWLPGGRFQGREYVCSDLAGGVGDSLSVNTEFGAWSDFATGDKGTDLVSLFAAVNRLGQGAAARELARQLGMNGGAARPLQGRKADDWLPILPVPDNAPEPDFHHNRLGNPVTTWTYSDQQGHVLGYVARFETAEGKQVLPLTYCAQGHRAAWRWKSFPGPRPLYGLDRLAAAEPDAPILLVEGEKTADAAQRIFPEAVALTWPGGSKAVGKADFSPLAGRNMVMVCPDADRPGFEAALAVATLMKQTVAVEVIFLSQPEGTPVGWDLADPFPEEMTKETLFSGAMTVKDFEALARERYGIGADPSTSPQASTRENDNYQASPPEGPAAPSRDNRVTRALEAAVTLETFRSMEITPRPFILDGLFRQGETGMVFAKTGVGKTFLSLCLAMGATRPGPVIGPYTTVNPCGVLYIDGEMSACDMQQRINSMAVQADGNRFHLLSSELLATDNQAIPALDDEWRPAILNWLHGHPDIGLVVLDNLSSLTPGVAEDKRLDWDAINQWIIELRRNGLSVLLVHHAGKGGDQRGTSAREDQLNLTLKLTALEDRKTTAFRVDFQKARGLSGEQKKPFVVELVENEHGKIDLLHKTVSDETTAQIAFLAVEGLSQIEIRDKTGVSQSGVSRRLKKAETDGLLVVRGAGPDKTYTLTDLGRAATLGMDAEAL